MFKTEKEYCLDISQEEELHKIIKKQRTNMNGAKTKYITNSLTTKYKAKMTQLKMRHPKANPDPQWDCNPQVSAHFIYEWARNTELWLLCLTTALLRPSLHCSSYFSFANSMPSNHVYLDLVAYKSFQTYCPLLILYCQNHDTYILCTLHGSFFLMF